MDINYSYSYSRRLRVRLGNENKIHINQDRIPVESNIFLHKHCTFIITYSK
jgi:hypothetical protein